MIDIRRLRSGPDGSRASLARRGDPAVLGPLLAEAGFDPQALLALTAEQDVKDALKANTEAAIKRGMFGAPTFFVGNEMFFGQDRLDFVREALV